MTANVDRRAQMLLAALLIATAALYLWNLSATGYGNLFYAAAAQAGSHSWSAWFFGSLDAHNFITVDKPPASLWVTGLSVRLFGMNSWSVLAPQAVMGAASVAVLYATVRRAFGDAAGGHGRGAVGRRGAGVHARCGVDLPVQQSGRAAGAAVDRGRLLPDPRGRGRVLALAGPGRARDGSRVPDQDARGLPAAARVRADLSAVRADELAQPPAPSTRRHRRAGRCGRVVGADGPIGSRDGAALHRRFDRQHRAPTRRRVQRHHPHSRSRRAKSPGRHAFSDHCAWLVEAGRRHWRRIVCSPPRWPTRFPGCCPQRC